MCLIKFYVSISRCAQDEDETRLLHADAGAFLSTSVSAARRQLKGALLTPKLPFLKTSLACMLLVTAHEHLPCLISHDVQQPRLSEKLILKLILYLDHHHQVILSSFLFPFMQ